MNSGADQVLPGDYYRANFHTLARFVNSTYDDQLSYDEKRWYNTICSLSEPAQSLYIRLLSRKGSTFRLSRLQYPEIEAIDSCATELENHALASLLVPIDSSVLLASFTKAELIDRLDLQSQRALSRSALLEYIECRDSDATAGYLQQLQQSEQWITLEGHACWSLMQLCFFGNLYQDSSEFVLRQLGTLKYEDYAITPSSRAFSTRQQIDAHWRYFECEALYEVVDLRCADELLQLCAMLPVSDKDDLTLRRRVDRLRNRIARQLERLSCTDQAMVLYKASVHPPARERQIRIMMARGQWQNAAYLAEQIHDQPYNEPELITAQRLLGKCRKALGKNPVKGRVFKPDTTKLVLRQSNKRVEEQARLFFSQKGLCFYTENSLINGVLGLFIWDIVFYPVPGVFYNPFQSAPADFKHPHFITRRRELLDLRFRELNDEHAFRTRVMQMYDKHFGKVNPLVRWHLLSIRMLTIAIERIPLHHWDVLFTRILKDLRENTSGFPDLISFPEKGGYEFIEIKGPGDTLQANQRRWMQYFDEHGIACRVVHIRYRLESHNPSLETVNAKKQDCS